MRNALSAKVEVATSVTDGTEATARREAIEAASSELMGVLTLIHAAYDLSSTGGNLVDVGLMTSAESRLNDMLLMTRDRVVKSLELLDQVSA